MSDQENRWQDNCLVDVESAEVKCRELETIRGQADRRITQAVFGGPEWALIEAQAALESFGLIRRYVVRFREQAEVNGSVWQVAYCNQVLQILSQALARGSVDVNRFSRELAPRMAAQRQQERKA